MFVASFLGNPAINYLDGVLDRNGAATSFRRGDLKIALPPKLASRVIGHEGQEVVLGLRPEDVCPAAAAEPGHVLSGIVHSVLPIGSDSFIGLKIEDRDIFLRLDKEARHREGTSIALGVVAERLHLFDKVSGLTLLEGGVS
jgi:multiple sugar transport system ATP-binding protein